jgi:hypothetical protein
MGATADREGLRRKRHAIDAGSWSGGIVMTTYYSPSLESRARFFSKKLSRDQLLAYAKDARKRKLPVERMMWRALQIYDEDRSLMASLAATDFTGDAIYDLRPNGRLPSDGVRP